MVRVSGRRVGRGPSGARSVLPLPSMRPWFLVLALVASGCGAGRGAAPATGSVRFVVVPETARIYTDDHFVGTARVLAERAEEFRAGPRRFTLTADGYFPHDLEVEVVPGTTTVEIRLRPVPP